MSKTKAAMGEHTTCDTRIAELEAALAEACVIRADLRTFYDGALTRIAELEVALAAAAGLLIDVQRKVMAHHSGGDSGMIFDQYDAAVERERKGYYTVDESAIDSLRTFLATPAAERGKALLKEMTKKDVLLGRCDGLLACYASRRVCEHTGIPHPQNDCELAALLAELRTL